VKSYSAVFYAFKHLNATIRFEAKLVHFFARKRAALFRGSTFVVFRDYDFFHVIIVNTLSTHLIVKLIHRLTRRRDFIIARLNKNK
jgi:hypothetical protein